MQIVNTLMGNFFHGDKDKISQMKNMGNNACFLMGYHDKVRFNDVCQIIHSLNNLFRYLTQVSILRASLTRRINQLI